MENKVKCLFLVGILMVAFLTESEAFKKCGHPLCLGAKLKSGMMPMGGFGGNSLLGGCLGGNPLLGGGFGGYPMLGGGFGGHPAMGGFGGGQAGVGYPVPYPVPVPVLMAPPYSSPYLSPYPPPYPSSYPSPYPSPYSSPYSSPPQEITEMKPTDGDYSEEESIPQRRECRCSSRGQRSQARRDTVVAGKDYGDY